LARDPVYRALPARLAETGTVEPVALCLILD
jgi:hypothetical protein